MLYFFYSYGALPSVSNWLELIVSSEYSQHIKFIFGVLNVNFNILEALVLGNKNGVLVI